ncbi:hypothetical protein DWF00_04155 [Bosea caraganae]|uniref:Uncharacterized protein n=1 Tax=Bosea caraganae TaxID=2763117 RepID=A0A370L5I2_9HYPH|nr:Imm50 family immunity protein [Bosea caraganae]RDJ24281.1 hypothetical protein DWE98_15385 [Bosea caraganae]RDJ30323.1 hypothetical protein DWF00_04155 [Bosea caraganae]
MIYADIPGGPELLQWFGGAPTFHDAEIIQLHLNRNGVSTLRLHGWVMTNEVDEKGFFVLQKHAVVTFAIEGIQDLKLDGFSHQNVIGGLTLDWAPDRGRSNYFPIPPSARDIEIELEPCFGMDGHIRAQRVSVTFEPGKPA